MKPVVILRPEPGASRTAERARQWGLIVQCHPLFVAKAIEWSAPPADRFDAILLTSAQTARLAGAGLQAYQGLPAYAVGSATAEAMVEAGFDSVTAGESDGSAIAARIAADDHVHVLHLGGRTVAHIEPGPLHIERVPVYEMVQSDDDLPEIMPGAILLVHSPRAGTVIARRLSAEQRAGLHIVAISPAALAACGEGWASAQATDKPNDESMLSLAARLCN